MTEQISSSCAARRLAQAEVTQKAKRLGIGAGLFGGRTLRVPRLAALITTAILALALVLPAWLAASSSCRAFAVAGVLALIGKKDVEKASPRCPPRRSPASRPTSPR